MAVNSCLVLLNSCLASISNFLTILVLGYIVYQVFRVKYYSSIYKMATLEQILDVDDKPQPKRERLLAIVSGGQSKEYLGKDVSIEKIEGMTDAEIDKLYARYEARLGLIITRNLGNTLIHLYSTAVSKYLSIDDQAGLVRDLQRDPFLGHALNSFTCGLYHRFGMFLAPLTTAVTTAKHCQLNNKTNNNSNGRPAIERKTGERKTGEETSNPEKSKKS